MRVSAPDYQESVRHRFVEQLADVERQAANLAEAIAMGGDFPALIGRLKGVEERRQALITQRDALGTGPMVPRIDLRAMERQARRPLADWRTLLGRHTEEARTVLRELLEGPLRFTPIEEETRFGYGFEGTLRIEG